MGKSAGLIDVQKMIIGCLHKHRKTQMVIGRDAGRTKSGRNITQARALWLENTPVINTKDNL